MKKLLILVFMLFVSGILKAQEQQVVVQYTLADRDRAIRTEMKMEALEVKMDIKFESIQLQINQLSTLFYWGFGIMITLFVFMMGYMIWDCRTALQPALDKATNSDVKSTTLVLALKEYSKKHADLAEILRTHGIL
jgi:hypothetical protein